VETGPIPPTIHRPLLFFLPIHHHLQSKIKSKKCKMKSDFGHFQLLEVRGKKKRKSKKSPDFVYVVFACSQTNRRMIKDFYFISCLLPDLSKSS
jgi:hypothetical protein